MYYFTIITIMRFFFQINYFFFFQVFLIKCIGSKINLILQFFYFFIIQFYVFFNFHLDDVIHKFYIFCVCTLI